MRKRKSCNGMIIFLDCYDTYFWGKKKKPCKEPNIMNPIKIPCLDVDTEFWAHWLCISIHVLVLESCVLYYVGEISFDSYSRPIHLHYRVRHKFLAKMWILKYWIDKEIFLWILVATLYPYLNYKKKKKKNTKQIKTQTYPDSLPVHTVSGFTSQSVFFKHKRYNRK